VVRSWVRIRWLAWELGFRLMFLIALFKKRRTGRGSRGG